MDQRPSETKNTPWIFARAPNGTKKPHTKNSGKWLIYGPSDKIDDLWKPIKEATEKGELGTAAKVSTLLRPKQYTVHVICVYTYDWTDEADVMDVREKLRKLGFAEAITYKTDADTLAGKYKEKGDDVDKYVS